MKRTLSIFAGDITASTQTRILAGDIVRYGVPGRTSAGLLRVRAGALRFPDDVTRVKLTEEHDRDKSRGYLQSVVMLPDRIRATAKVSDGPLGDAALLEAKDKTRDGFSFDVVDAQIEGDEIVDALVIAVGQVGIPAYDETRIDTIAASQTPARPHPTEGRNMLTEAQRQRLAALRSQTSRTPDEQVEFDQLVVLEGQQPAQQQPAQPDPHPSTQQPPAQPEPQQQPQQVAASLSAVPSGVPRPTQQAHVTETGALDRFVRSVTAALSQGGSTQAITAALSDITQSSQGDVFEVPAWSGELWSGLAYESVFTPLLNAGNLTSWKGAGWRFVDKPVIQDYAGNKTAIPSGTVTTEPSEYEAARMAVGHDIDRKFYDFPDAGFLQGYVEAVRESWAVKLDAKVEAYIAAAAVAVGGAAQPTLLKAVARVIQSLKTRRVGRATFVVVNDSDFFTLMDMTSADVPAFLELFGVDPRNFVSSPLVTAGTVIGGVKQAATVRTLPGSPIRVSAQDIAKGGIDEAFFGYWAIEEHHTAGIAKATFTAPA